MHYIRRNKWQSLRVEAVACAMLLLIYVCTSVEYGGDPVTTHVDERAFASPEAPRCDDAAPCAGITATAGPAELRCSMAFPELARLLAMPDSAVAATGLTHSMIGPERMATNIAVVNYVLAARIRGDIVEAGVAKGGSAASLFLAAAARGDPRGLHLFDTFAGMPAPNTAVDSVRAAKWIGRINHSQPEVEAFMTSVGIPRGMTSYHVGDIVATPEAALPCAIALFRLDTDWYASYTWALQHMYPRISPGGIILLDDYYDWPGARKAVDAFRKRPANADVGFGFSKPPMLCKPLRDGTAAPCGLDEFAAAIAAGFNGTSGSKSRPGSTTRGQRRRRVSQP